MISNEVLIVVISSVAGLIGYAIREWQNRVRPFISIVSFGGGYFKLGTEITLSPEITKKTEKAFYVRKLKERTNLRNIDKAKDDAVYLSEDAPKIISRIDEFLGTLRSDESNLMIFKSLKNLFNSYKIDVLIGILLMSGRTPIPKTSKKEYIYDLSESTQISGGCYVLSYQGETLYIGTRFNDEKLLKVVFEPLIQILMTVDKDSIITTFETMKKEINAELNVANSILSELQNIINNNSRWETELFIANLKRTPLLLESDAFMRVTDKTGATFYEECELYIHEKDADGEDNLKRSKNPIIIPSGGNISISYFTRKSQKEMERGNDFRNSFTHKQAKARLTLSMLGVGLVKKRTYKTDEKVFAE